MRLSYCIPAHKRTPDLVEALPDVIVAAQIAQRVEVLIVDYGNNPALDDVLRSVVDSYACDYYRRDLDGQYWNLHTHERVDYAYRAQFPQACVTLVQCAPFPHFHMAHARNIAIRAAAGEYVLAGATDIRWRPHALAQILLQTQDHPDAYLRSCTSGYIGVVTAPRDVLLAIGGYDERFEFYGKEDRDLLARLDRYYQQHGLRQNFYDLDAMIIMRRTHLREKRRNYRITNRAFMNTYADYVWQDNQSRNVIVVNETQEWGSVWQQPPIFEIPSQSIPPQ